MSFQNIRWTEDGAVVYDQEGRVRQMTRCTIHLNEQDAADVDDYVKRFCLKGATLDAIMSLIFRMGLREMKAQTDLDRYLDEQDEQHMDKVRA